MIGSSAPLSVAYRPFATDIIVGPPSRASQFRSIDGVVAVASRTGSRARQNRRCDLMPNEEFSAAS